MDTGKVYLVGAGPGHPELLTVKAMELLKAADVVVYDRLIQEEVLALSKPAAERIYMGKPVGKHDSRQQEIHELLVRKSREGKMVVRLKGGDPFMFGRGGEEVEYLADHGIPFEVIPGVSSALAAPLSAGIAVTHRNASSSVAIVTGHEAQEESSRLDWGALARIETLVFLMGVHNIGRISRRLITHGRDPETPAAVIQMAFWHDEHVVTGRLADIADEVKRTGIKPPATLVIGEVVRLREKLKGAERDLRRRPDSGSRFEPAPAPDQLLRLATTGLGAKALGYALDTGIFDLLEERKSSEDLARELALDRDALEEILDALTALGILEAGSGGYRNLELASRYLTGGSPQSLKRFLLEQIAPHADWSDLADYAARGCGEPARKEPSYYEACEALARFAAPSVVEQLDFAGCSSALLVGWGGSAYREALARSRPSLTLDACNPFDGSDRLEAGKEGAYDVVILSGLLASSNGAAVQKVLEQSAAKLRPGGLLALHDSFLPSGVLPPPEVVLGGLGRRIARGGCRIWPVERVRKALRALGFPVAAVRALPAATVLVTARRTDAGVLEGAAASKIQKTETN